MLARKAASGAIWLAGGRLLAKSLDLISLLVVARLLTPADFGLFALAATVLLVLNAITDLSLANAIVQMKDPPARVYDTAFTLSCLRGLVVGGALAAVASSFAGYYGDERLAPILYALCVVPMIRALASPRLAHLQRKMQFRQTFFMEVAGRCAAFAASVIAAWLTQSYWALVAGMIAAPLLSSLISYGFAPYRPRLDLIQWRAIFAFSGWLTLSNTVNTINWQADRLFIGGQLGPDILGQYTVGSELASLPTNTPILPIMQSLYAAFSKLSHDLDRLRAAYLMSQAAVLALALPIAVTVSVFAHAIISIAVGPQWAASAIVIEILAPVFAVQMLTGPAQSIAMAQGRTDTILYRDLLALAIRLPLILIGLYLAGLQGVIWARVASGLAIILLNLLLIRRILGIGLIKQIFAPWRSFVSASLLALFMIFVDRELGLREATDISALVGISILSAAGFALYGGIHILLWSFTRPIDSAEQKLLNLTRSLGRA